MRFAALRSIKTHRNQCLAHQEFFCGGLIRQTGLFVKKILSVVYCIEIGGQKLKTLPIASGHHQRGCKAIQWPRYSLISTGISPIIATILKGLSIEVPEICKLSRGFVQPSFYIG